MRFVCRMRPRSSVARSREIRRQSSSLGLGGTVMAQTRGSPRRHAISVRKSVSPVDRIRLGASMTARHGNRRRVDDVALDAVGLEQAMNPETIESDFVDCPNLDRRCNALLGSCLQAREKVEQLAPVAAGERVLGHLLAAGRQRRGNPCRTTQL